MNHFSRRSVLVGIAAVTVTGSRLNAREITDLEWSDVLPAGAGLARPALPGLSPHDETAPASAQPTSTGMRTDWNGKTVRLKGFVVPLTYSGTGVTASILVPYVGACIHVPPPPANQLVLVATEDPYKSDGLFEAVSVTGTFGIVSTSTEFAEVGYGLSAKRSNVTTNRAVSAVPSDYKLGCAEAVS